MASHNLRIRNILLCHPWDDNLHCEGSRELAAELMHNYPGVKYTLSDVNEYGFTIDTEQEDLPRLSDNFLSLAFNNTRFKECVDISNIVSYNDMITYFMTIIPHQMHMPYPNREFKKIIQALFKKPALQHELCELRYKKKESKHYEARYLYFTNMSQKDIAWLKLTLAGEIKNRIEVI